MSRASFAGRFVFPALTLLLPLHIVVIAFLFGGLHLPAPLVRSLASWKEAVIVLTLLLTVANVATGRSRRSRVTWLDIAVAAMLLLALAFLLVQPTWTDPPTGLVGQLYGARDLAFFLVAYFIGRGTPDLGEREGFLKQLFVVAILTAAVGVAEQILIKPEHLVLLGAVSYFQDFLNVKAFTVGNEYGLPSNYWTFLGSHAIRRSGSVYLSSQGFAIPFLLLMPAATLWMLLRPRRWWWWPLYAIAWAGLLCSVTRMTIVACVVETLILAVLLRRPSIVVATVATAGGLLVAAMLAIPEMAGFVVQTLTWQTASSASHAKDWALGVMAFADHPLGAGLGTTDQTAVRNGLLPLTADNQFLKFGVETGVLGFMLHLLVIGGIAAYGTALMRRAQRPEARALGMLLIATTVGILLNGMTAVVYNSMVLSYLYFWLAGTAVALVAAPPDGGLPPEANGSIG